MITKSIKFLVLLAIFASIPQASCQCFNPDGSIAPNPPFIPCDQTKGSIGMCCAKNRSNPSGGSLSDGFTEDICLFNGLCQNNFETTDSNGQLVPGTTFWRESCTSSNGSGCLSVCSDDDDGNGDAQVTPCDGSSFSEQWCCGSNTDCCGTSNAITIPQIFRASGPSPFIASRSSTSRGGSVSSQSTSTIIVTVTSSTSTSSSSGHSTSPNAGIGITLVVGGLAILAVNTC